MCVCVLKERESRGRGDSCIPGLFFFFVGTLGVSPAPTALLPFLLQSFSLKSCHTELLKALSTIANSFRWKLHCNTCSDKGASPEWTDDCTLAEWIYQGQLLNQPHSFSKPLSRWQEGRFLCVRGGTRSPFPSSAPPCWWAACESRADLGEVWIWQRFQQHSSPFALLCQNENKPFISSCMGLRVSCETTVFRCSPLSLKKLKEAW